MPIASRFGGNSLRAFGQRGAISLGPILPDPFFSYVSLLLSTTSLNNTQNNTFVDGSSNNFTPTRYGNTTQGSFSPYGSRWSYYFDGTGDYLSNSSSGVMTGDFTVELWMYLENYNSSRGIYTVGSETTQRVGFYITTSGRLAWDLYGAGTTTIGSDNSVPVRAWTHVAFVKSAGTMTGYINGTAVGSASMNYTFGNANGFVVLGDFIGYASDFRVVNGTAVYTSNFTPPTTPLTAIANTFLHTAQSNRIRDNSTNNFALTRNGDVRVTPFSPYSPSTEYSAATNFGSIYLDGTGDYLSFPSSTAFGFGSGDFTVEFWFYYASGSLPSPEGRYYSFGAVGGSLNLTQYGGIGLVNEVVSHLIINSGVNPDLGQWNHIAMTRSSSTIRLFKNGVQFASTTSSTGNSSAIFELYSPGAMGCYYSGLRIVKGTAVYTSNFTPPTTPPTAISGTSLLLNPTNANIFDATAINDIETVGNAQVGTTVKKYGSSSIYLDGTGDWLSIPNNIWLDFGSGNFTIEFWINFNSVTGASIGIFGKRADETIYAPFIMEMSSSALRLYMSNNGSTWGVNGLSTSTLSTGTWYHIAIVRSGTTVYLFVNGTSVGSTGTISGALATNTSSLIIGNTSASPNVVASLNGYIDDFRISRGIARYTSNFTPPTRALPTR